MNRINIESRLRQAKDTGKALVARGAAVGSGFMVAGSAFAQEAFDTSEITGKITTYSGYALVLVLAFAAAVWALRAAGLLGKR